MKTKLHYLSMVPALAALGLLALPAPVQAQFTFTTNNSAITITGYTGTNAVVIIPNATNGYPVTTIGASAFSGTRVTSVTIPPGVTSIGPSAFDVCSNLTSVAMSDTVLNIGDNAFSDCISLAGVTIPGLLPRLGNGLFIGCTSLTNIALGNSITSIGTNAFNDCTSLTSVTIPYGVTNLGQAAFGNCTSLTYVCFQGNVPTSSGNLVFLSDPVTVIYYLAGTTGWGSNYEGIATAPCAQCSQTTPNPYNGFYWTQVVNAVTITLYDGAGGSVVIPATIAGLPVTSIGANAFFGGASLTSVTIGTNVTSIGLDAFAECYSLTAITVASNNPAYVSVAGVLFNQGQTTLIEYPAASAETSYAIPGTVTNIGDYAFAYCKLPGITIPNGVTSIGENAFAYSFSLASVTIPNTVTNLGAGAFTDCTSLTNVTIPNGVTSIGPNTFYYCTSLASVTIPDSVTSLGIEAFFNCTSLADVTVGNGLISIGEDAFSFCKKLARITLPDSVTSIGTNAFQNCGLTNVTIPNSVTSIGDDAFSGCAGLTNVCFEGNAPTSIGNSVFRSDPVTVILYVSGATGWGSNYEGIPIESCAACGSIGVGGLRVTINPPAAVQDGAQWQVDGGAWQNSGAVVSNLPASNHTLSFTNIVGWFTPAAQTVTINSGVTTNISATYVPNLGALQVTINPICAVENGAEWQVDGGAWQTSGAVVTNLAGGNHTVSFNSITGWITPSSQTVLVAANTTNTTAGNYLETSTPGMITWINGGGGANVNWSSPTNWDLNRAPITSDIVLIPNTGRSACVMDIDAAVAGLVIGECAGSGSDGLNMSGHTLTVNGPIMVKSNAVFGVSSGILIGTSNTIVSGVVGWTSGTLGGTLTLAGNSVLNLSATTYNKNLNCTLTNYGTVNWSGDQLNGGGAGTVVYNYGLWNAQDNQTFGGAGTVFNNYGIFRKSGGASTFPGTLFYGVLFNQAGGVLDVQNGTNGLELVLQGGGSFTGGYVTTNSNGFIYLSIGDFNLNGTTTSSNVVEGAGLVGTNVIRGALNWQNGNWSGSVTVSSNSVVIINATTYGKTFNGLVTNYGTVNWSSDQLNGNGGAVIYNYGLWNARDNQSWNGTVFNNYGTFRKSGGVSVYPGTLFTSGSAFNQAGGVIDVQAGELTSQGTYSLTNGTLSFGINNLTNYGQLLLGGAALGGPLSVNVSGNFAPALGEQFQVVASSGLTGTFSSVNVPTGISVAYSVNGVFLNVTGPVAVQILSPQQFGTNFLFQFPTASGQSYTIQRNDDLATTNWVFYTNVVGDGSAMQVQVPAAATPAKRFFRVREP